MCAWYVYELCTAKLNGIEGVAVRNGLCVLYTVGLNFDRLLLSSHIKMSVAALNSLDSAEDNR